MLLLTDEDIQRALPLRECMREAVDAVERATLAQAEGRVLLHDRIVLNYRRGEERGRNLIVHPAIVDDQGAAVRLFTYRMGRQEVPRERRTHGLTALFDFGDMALVALLEDGHLNVVRTGAPSGLAVRHLAPPEASDVGFIGSGEQAPGQLAAVCAVRLVSRVRVYSPTQAHRERFAHEMASLLDLEVVACSTAREAVEGADIVLTVTSTRTPVIERSWLAPGTTIISVAPNELDEETVLDSRVITSSVERVLTNRNHEPFSTLVPQGRFTESDVTEMTEVVAGRAPGRERPDQLVTFISTGLALWDVAVPDLTYRRAIEMGIGERWP